MMSKASFFLLYTVLITSFCIPAVIGGADNREIPLEHQKKEISRPPYCGLFCLYASMRLSGHDIDFENMVSLEYIGPSPGSSLAQLKDAAEDHGMHAEIMTDLTTRDLRECPYPVILHVKSKVFRSRYDHYELFLGSEDGKAKLYDPPNPIMLVPFRELALRWGGNGLLISAEPIDLVSVLAPARRRSATYLVIVLGVIFIVRLVRRRLTTAIPDSRSKLSGLYVAQGAGFVIVAMLCGMVYNFANDEGMLANANTVALIQEVNRGTFISKISEKKVSRLLDGGAVFIDARNEYDFKAGHLEGAINVPVYANDVERRKTTSDITMDSLIVVYCQSSRCKYAEKVAIKLIKDGFSNICIFKGGWAEWVAKNGKSKEKTI